MDKREQLEEHKNVYKIFSVFLPDWSLEIVVTPSRLMSHARTGMSY